MRRLLSVAAATSALLVFAGPALACGGLIGPNGAVNLLRTTTLAGYHDGVEHYVTAFAFAGGEGEFGSLVPLPDIPTSVEKGGDWTLQRLVRETDPQLFLAEDAALAGAARAEVLMQVRIDALDITILRGGGPEVGAWATEHGFRLPPDAPEVLDFYANRSPIFLAAVFDADAAAARGQAVGDGTPVHITIPTDNPWVPLRILALGKSESETVEADVYLLTDERPGLLPNPGSAAGRPRFRAGAQRARNRSALERSPLRPGHGVGPHHCVADQGSGRWCRSGYQLRPRHCRERRRAIDGGRRVPAVRAVARALGHPSRPGSCLSSPSVGRSWRPGSR